MTAKTPNASAGDKPWLEHYPAGAHDLKIPHASLHTAFEHAAKKFAGRTALEFYGKNVTYAKLSSTSENLAGALKRLGVGGGERVALYLLNSPQFVSAYLAVLKAGGVVAGISPELGAPELARFLAASDSRFLICHDLLYDNVVSSGAALEGVVVASVSDDLPFYKRWFRPTVTPTKSSTVHRLEALVKETGGVPEADLAPSAASLVYTAGTTGEPKGVLLSHANLLAALSQAGAFSTSDKPETVAAFLPFTQAGPQVLLLGSLLRGDTLVVLTTPNLDKLLFAVERHRVSVLYGVPALFERLLHHPKRRLVAWQRLRRLVSSGDTLPPALRDAWTKHTGTQLSEAYGLAETGGVSHAQPPGRAKPGSFGVPLPGVDARVVDPATLHPVKPGEVGELLLSGPNVIKNDQHEDESAFTRLGGERYLRSGDLVRMDEDGYFYFVDRASDLIRQAGRPVFPKAVEEALQTHPQVKGAGVVGLQGEVGPYLKAFVVLQAEARGKVTEEALKRYLEGRLEPHQLPRVVEFRGELPKTAAGKVARRELREGF